MAWCPKCKRDYVDDITECKECQVPLLNGESDNYDLLLKDSNEENVYTIYNYLNETTNYTTELYEDEENGLYVIYALKDEIENIKKAIIMYLEDELKHSDSSDELVEIMDTLEEETHKDTGSATYVSAKDKYDERTSSAFSTLLVGLLGLAFMILKFMGISFINFSGFSDILFNVTMTTIFAIFTIVGIVTYKSARALKISIVVEEDLIEELKKFMDEKVNAEAIDAECDFTDETEELKYFARQSVIKEKINAEFDIKDETLVDQLIDEYYPLIFTTEK